MPDLPNPLESPAYWGLVTIFNTFLTCMLAISIWVFNRNTQIKKSKSQQPRKRPILKDQDQEENIWDRNSLYFNDWSRSNEREKLLRKLSKDFDLAAKLETSDGDDESDGEENRNVKSAARTPLSPEIKERRNMLKSISKLKVFAYLSDEAFLKCLSFIEYVELPKIGSQLFSDDRPFDGSMYIVLEGGVTVMCSLSAPLDEEAITHSAGPGDIVTSLLSMLAGLVQHYQKAKSPVNDKNRIAIETSCVSVNASVESTRLIRIPPACFLAVLEECPRDVYHIAMTTLARSQRVTISTLVKNLGLGYEILYNHGNSIPIKCDSKNVLPTPSEEESEFKSLVREILESEELNSSEESIISVNNRTGLRIANLLSHVIGSTAQECIRTLEKEIQIVSVPAGEVILHGEKKADYIYFVIDGSLEVGTILNPEKGLKGTSHYDDIENDSFHLLYHILPGDTFGQMSCFTDEVSFVTVRTASRKLQKPSVLVKLPKEVFCSLVASHSGIIIQCINKILTVDFSPLVHLLDWGIDWKHVQAGTLLAKKGEVCDKMQVVLSGRLKAGSRIARAEGFSEDEYGRGTCIGETHVLTGTEWQNDVYAIRNSELAILSINVLQYVMQRFPQTAIHFAKAIAKKMHHKKRNTTQEFSVTPAPELSVATLAVVPLCFDSSTDASGLCHVISTAIRKYASCKLMTRSIARQNVGKDVFNLRNALAEQRILRFLSNDLSNDPKLTFWTKICIQQADCVLLVANAEAAPSCEQVERYLSWAFEKLLVRHVQVIVLQQVKQVPSETSDEKISVEQRVPISKELNEWIDQRVFIEGQHLIRRPLYLYGKDVDRMCRRVTGRSLGLALGGGGARGLAHLGVIRALLERGVQVDICGGTSQGAFIGALFAQNPDDFSKLLESSRQMASSMASMKEKILDLTLPIVSYFNGTNFNKQIMECIGEKTMISDLILNFFCTSTDLSKPALVIHTKGLCWKYVRASMSLHGYLPPVSEDGHLLVDGGYMNIVPGDILLEQMNAKAVICVDVAKEDTGNYFNYGTSLNGFWLLVNSLNPFVETVRVPSMGELSHKLIWVSSVNQRESVQANADLFLKPPVQQYGTLDYDKLDEIIEVGYEYAKPRLDAFIERNPWVVS
eukprot:CAMPEP_0178906706 /NCGR_PEP_ID=MMETSP0786-20121207/6970_1 /TAXON_ID=186022 /ORGANISM="Thalassionema frauenfeldii, Strain CCMP 1798" /LENGTH=1130 /DNA_ID=CAMNT_0020578435 /DNA_START=61 /DNA_END=3454 /DNA_ORIENTATION=+